MNADNILAIALDEPERLLRRPDFLRDDYLILLKTWHPDINHHPLADKVTAHIQALYSKAQEKIALKIWNPPGILLLTGKDKKTRKIKYRAKYKFELGVVYVGDNILTFVVPKTHEDFILSGLRGIGTIRYPNEEFRQNLELYFPKIEQYFETDISIVVCMRKRRDEILLSDLIGWAGGRLDPKHVAWIISSLFNLASFLQITELTVNGIEPSTVFVSTPTHSLSILGGWWYSASFGKPLKSLPPNIYKLASRKILIAKKATPFLDLESIRACGRAALGDITGSSFRMRDDIPKPMASYLMLPSSNDAVREYENWVKVLEESFGPRKFVKLEALPEHIYKDVV